MSVHTALGYGRALQEARFTETVTVGEYTRITGMFSGDPVRTLVAASYEGPAQVKYPSPVVATSQTTGQPVAAQDIIVKLPSGTVVQVGDEVTVTASTVDPSLVGSVFRVTGSAQKGQTTAARYPVVELS